MVGVAAAGSLPWRRRRGRLQVALVHRPKYDDWSWAKGKLDPGETFSLAAVRETLEETGLRVRLGRPLPTTTYTVSNGGGPAAKEVRYWASEVVGGDGGLVHEVDEVAWLGPEEAAARLSYRRDHPPLEALIEADARGALATWPLALVRHAKARARSSWRKEDRLRPLDAQGRRQALDLIPLLSAYGITRIVSSPSTRARDTVAPYADASDVRLRLHPGLSEEGFARDPSRAAHHLERLLQRGAPAVLCSHGPVLPDLIALLRERADSALGPALEPGLGTLRHLEDALDSGLAKGETLLTHIAGIGSSARLVAVERHRPPARD